MTRLGASPAMLLLPLTAVVLAFAALLSFSLVRMFDVENNMRVDAEQNMLWVLHQSEVSALRMAETIARAELGEASAEDVSLRFDLLASRVALLNDGPQRRLVERMGYDDELEELTSELQTLGSLVDGFTPQRGPDLRALLVPFSQTFGRAAGAAMIHEWEDLGGRLAAYRAQLRQIIASLIGITVAGGILTISLVLSLRQARSRNSMLRRERDFSGLLVSSSGEGILAVDMDGNCTVWNAAAAEIVDRSSEQAVGQSLPEVAEIFDQARVKDALAQVLSGRTAQLLNLPMNGAGSADRTHVDLRLFPMRNDGAILGAVLFFHDVTDRYAAEQKEAQDRDRLEELVAERTRELDDALKRERSATDLYRNFAAMVSHQFRTPLAVADSAMQRLIRRGTQAEPDEIQERAGRARDAIAALTRLVDSTLNAARLDAGQIGARREPCDLSKIVGMVCARQQDITPQFPLQIRSRPSERVEAYCDPSHVEQVLEMLLSNAVKYATKGTSVWIALQNDDTEIHCDIRNTGTTIPDEDRERIFDRNYRGANSVGVAGTGLGLFMARTLARMQGGDITLLDGGEDVVFRLSLPRAARSPS